MNFLQAAGIAMIPSVVWGWFFISRNPESRQLVIVTFLLGTLAVVPLLLFMAGLGVQLQKPRGRSGSSSAARTRCDRRSACSSSWRVALVMIGVIKLFS
jgi:RsiW-degrading membrane proteinase PrsW (M82 family)